MELIDDDEARQKLSARGSARACDYDWSEVTRSVLSIYAKALQNR
jgi:phosphatidyl-myo-inositol alpha-mannosyltransferase